MMRGSLCARAGVLYVGRSSGTSEIAAYDFDGRALGPSLRFRAPDGGRSCVAGLSVDEDHRLWVADAWARSLRCFTLHGVEVAHAAASAAGLEDRMGALGVPIDVLSLRSDEEQRLLVAARGVRRHALQSFPLSPLGGRTRSLRPEGDPAGRFQSISRIAGRGRLLYVCERGAGRVQVFRDQEHHFSFALPPAAGRFEPVALAPLADGRAVLAQGGEHSALLLVDAGGRLLGVLASAGSGEGAVLEPADLALEADESGAESERARVAVIDLGGDRVQVFELSGRFLGSFPDLLPSWDESAG